jgi:hypothetical protein
MKGNAPQYLLDLAPNAVGNRTGYRLRNRDNLDTTLAKVNCLAHSFFPSVTKLWNDLTHVRKNKPSISAFKYSHTKTLPKKNRLFYHGSRLESCILARMRINNSPLNDDLCNDLHVITSPLCPCGSGSKETHEHYFFKCQLFDQERLELKTNLLPYVVNDVNFLLFGIPNEEPNDNLHIFDAVHKYIRDTKRFY